MIGLEYILNLYNLQHIELAEKLGIKKTKYKHVSERATKHSKKISTGLRGTLWH